MKQLLLSILVSVLFFPATIFAQSSYSTLIDGTPLSDTNDIGQYLNSIYLLAIVAAALFAVVKIIIAGVKYMVSDIVPTKEDAKKDIRTALLGLIIIISAVLILNTINPNLTDFDLKFVKPKHSLSLDGTPLVNDLEEWDAPSCVRKGSDIANGYSAAAISVDDCDEETRAKALEEFTTICGEQGSKVSKDSNRPNTYTCYKQVFVERWKISIYDEGVVDLGDEYAKDSIEYKGTQVSFRAREYCVSKHPGSTSDFIDSCIDDASEAFLKARYIDVTDDSYCENNGGKPKSQENADVLVCEMPIAFSNITAMRRDFGPINNEEDFARACAKKDMQLVHTHRSDRAGVGDMMCVRYANTTDAS